MNVILNIAKNCRPYAMCKIDFPGSRVCSSGLERHFVSFYPQGRMILYEALAEHRIPVTEKCVETADSCNLCGKCDYQCYSVNEICPTKVMEALKNHVAAFFKKEGGEPKPAKNDGILTKIRNIVRNEWATNNLGTTITCFHDLSHFSEPKTPDYVVFQINP